jgi:hypothetical protein
LTDTEGGRERRVTKEERQRDREKYMTLRGIERGGRANEGDGERQ